MKKLLLNLFLFIGAIGFAQEYAYFDFGNSTYTTSGNWNNVVVTSQNQEGLTLNVINGSGIDTGILFTLSDSFDHINSSGTTMPNSALPFPDTASRDSFFGATDAGFNGNVNPSGGFTLSGLDPLKYYSFSVFSSRNGVSDNRETLYTVTGTNSKNEPLDPANNTSNTADLLNIQPNASGQIIFLAEPGPNNTNSFGFYYLGAIQLVISDTPISDISPDPELALSYPNGNNIWVEGRTARIKWTSISVSDITIDFSSDNGVNWANLATAPAAQQYYDIVVPNLTSTDCLIRISGEGITDTSDAVFEIIPDNGAVYKIVVLGSSTAAGTGPSDINDAWVWKYQKYLTEMDLRYEVVNLALGGFATYNILPTGTAIPSGVNRTIDTQRNITKAIDIGAKGIIINLPSNDAASGYPVADQLNNYGLISTDATNAGIPIWVTTPQPRNFGSNTTNLAIQQQMVTETYNTFGDDTIDFWTGFGESDGNGILAAYDAGDGIHMNAAAHQILYDRVIGKAIHVEVKNAVDNALSTNDIAAINDVVLFPNPISDHATIKFGYNLNGNIKIAVINVMGQIVDSSSYTVVNGEVTWNKNELESGIYFMNISYENKQDKLKIIIN